MEHADQVDRDDALPFSGIEVEKGGRLTNADAAEEHIQSAEFTDRRRNPSTAERSRTSRRSAAARPPAARIRAAVASADGRSMVESVR
jgi:hypothetical protein